jgi:glucans biosynthesis protein
MMPAYFANRASGLLVWLTAVLASAAILAEEATEVPGETVERLFHWIQDDAAARARVPYRLPEDVLPTAFREMDYDQYRAMRFRPESALWRGETRFEVQFFHPGFLFREPVTLRQWADGRVKPLSFDSDLFIYEGPAQAFRDDARASEFPGFAGFRLHFPMNRPDYKDEVMVFLGASYFRLVGPGQVYGLSTRGLAVDTGLPSGEEFPQFREFWLVRPEPEDDTVTVLARLDSPSVTGAYRFDLRVSPEVTVEVEKHLFARRDIARLGIAPLTSMFLFGDLSVRGHDDFRPRVHDSEGLMSRTARDEWIWRPLNNPRVLRVSSLRDQKPQGFGLVQRNREFGAYLDMEAEYHRRPSQWVSPIEGDWGSGGVELVEIPATSETYDNIVMYWVSDEPVRAGDERYYRYRLTLFDDAPPGDPPARVGRSRSGWGAIPGAADAPPRSLRRYVVDFSGGRLTTLGDDAPLQIRLDASGGTLDDLRLRRLPADGGWRATFLLEPGNAPAVDLRLALTLDGDPVTETWNHVWYPDEL